MSRSMCAVVGGFVGALFAMIVCSFFPIGIHSQDILYSQNFGMVTCTGLQVVNRHGVPVIDLSRGDGGSITIRKSAKTETESYVTGLAIGAEKNGNGYITIFGNKRRSISIKANEKGGEVIIFGKNSTARRVILRRDEYSGKIAVLGEENAGEVQIGISDRNKGDKSLFLGRKARALLLC